MSIGSLQCGVSIDNHLFRMNILDNINSSHQKMYYYQFFSLQAHLCTVGPSTVARKLVSLLPMPSFLCLPLLSRGELVVMAPHDASGYVAGWAHAPSLGHRHLGSATILPLPSLHLGCPS